MAEFQCPECRTPVNEADGSYCPSCGAPHDEHLRLGMTRRDWRVGVAAFLLAFLLVGAFWLTPGGMHLPSSILDAVQAVRSAFLTAAVAFVFACVAVAIARRTADMTRTDWSVGVTAYLGACAWWLWRSGVGRPASLPELVGVVGEIIGFSVWALLFAYIVVLAIRKLGNVARDG